MPSKASAHSEQSKQPPINLASLPREEAIKRARAAGRGILIDGTAVAAVFLTLWTDWMSANIPNACGRPEDEFGELVNAMMDEFNLGVNEFVRSASIDPVLERVESLLSRDTFGAWKIHNTLAFMVAALPEDAIDALPTHSTLSLLCEDAKALASGLMDLAYEVNRG